MNRNSLIETLKAYDAALRENGATALFVFGSRARGAERDDSDLDLFIDYDPAVKIPNMFRLMQIEEKISATLGIPVTITTRDALHPLMKKNIERDAVRSPDAEGSDHRHPGLPDRDSHPAGDLRAHDASGIPQRSDCAPRRSLCHPDHFRSRAAHSRRMACRLRGSALGRR